MPDSTREKLRATAHANGWGIDEHHELGDTFTRGGEQVLVRFSTRGGIVVAARKAPGDRYLTELPGTGKAATVATLLAGR